MCFGVLEADGRNPFFFAGGWWSRGGCEGEGERESGDRERDRGSCGLGNVSRQRREKLFFFCIFFCFLLQRG
jgi:hypothetical protein